MIFRNVHDELVEINRYHFKNDKIYYEKIMEIKKQILNKCQTSKLDYQTKSKETLNNKNN